MNKIMMRVLLDAAMLVLYVLLCFADRAGAFFHEAVGLGIGLLFIIHILLNRRMMSALSRARRSGKLPFSRTILYYMDLFLPWGLLLVVATGVAVSTALFSFNLGSQWELVSTIHDVSAYICLGVLILHLLLHASFLKAVARQMAARRGDGGTRRTMAAFTAALAVVCLCYFLGWSAYKSNLLKETLAGKNSVTAWIAEPSGSDSEILIVEGQTDRLSDNESDGSTAEISEPDTDSDQDESATTVSQAYADEEQVSLDQFLSSLFCQGCSRHCPLTSLSCSKGTAYLEEAKSEYQALYGVTDV